MRSILALAAVAVVAGCVQMTPITSSKPVPLNSQQIQQIQATVTHSFFDPSSAQFRNIRQVDVTLNDGSQERRICGEVNGKNRMGGYVGFQMFGGSMQAGRFVQQDFFSPCEAW